MEDSIIIINKQFWESEDSQAELKNRKDWEVAELIADSNCRPTIILDISHIEFHQLLKLDISNNHISSVEELGSILMPVIEDIHLQFNQIRVVQCFRKVRWPKLCMLSLGANSVCDWNRLIEVPFQFKCLLIDPMVGLTKPITEGSMDLRFLLKVDAPMLFLYAKNQRLRIQNNLCGFLQAQSKFMVVKS